MGCNLFGGLIQDRRQVCFEIRPGYLAQSPLEQLNRLLHVAARAEVLAVGSRDLAGSHLVRRESHLREFLGRSYNRLLQATVAPGVLDTQCGAKAASARVWDPILAASRENGYAWDAEAVGIARALDITVHEVPIDWRHDDRSKVHVARDGGVRRTGGEGDAGEGVVPGEHGEAQPAAQVPQTQGAVESPGDGPAVARQSQLEAGPRGGVQLKTAAAARRSATKPRSL